MKDDFYYNLLDWSASNLITIGLLNHLYILNVTNNNSFKLWSYNEDSLVSSISSHKEGDLLAAGNSQGEISIFDMEKGSIVRTIDIHNSRIGAIAWKENVLATGSKDSSIFLTDIRSKNAYHNKLTGHRQEICGLKFNPFDYSLASGGNDNKVIVWDCPKAQE